MPFVPFEPGNKLAPGRRKGSKNRMTAATVENELRKIATLDPIHLFQRKKGVNGAVRFQVRDLAAMPADARACIARLRVRLERRDKDSPPDEILEIWFWDKVKALELCAKHFGWVSTKATVLVGRELRELLEEGRKRNAEFRAQQAAIDVTPGREVRQLDAPPAFDVTPVFTTPGLSLPDAVPAELLPDDDEDPADVVI